ncbi:hypothetical protein MMC22_011718 [Lobaria immixta]|nr:hypothetical protein [Lobaria immixta]
MQIPKLGLLSLLSSISLASSSFGSVRPIHHATSFSSPDQVVINAASYGYKGPGVYRITGLHSSLNVDLNGTSDGSLVNLQPPSNANSQRWLIAYVGKGQVIIINNGTGLYLSATTGASLFGVYLGAVLLSMNDLHHRSSSLPARLSVRGAAIQT